MTIKAEKVEEKIPKIQKKLGSIKESTSQGTHTEAEYNRLEAFNLVSIGYNGSSSIYGQRDLSLEMEDFSFPVFLSSFTNYLKDKSMSFPAGKRTTATLNYNCIDYKTLQEFLEGENQKEIYEEFKAKNKSNVQNQSKIFQNFASFINLIEKTIKK